MLVNGPRIDDSSKAPAQSRQGSATVSSSAADDCPSSQRCDVPPVADPETAEAFIQRMYKQHAAFLQAFVLSLTGGDRHWAEDVAQETLVRAWRLADRLQENGQRGMLPWLITVARRIVMNDRRSRRARPQEVFGALFEPTPTADELEQALQRKILLDALAKIGEAHRRVIVAIYLLGKSTEEVAQLLSIPCGTVKSRSYYGLRAMREILHQQGVSE
jgi:RNA polymerase sigma-70 factor (ECF subfamily)